MHELGTVYEFESSNGARKSAGNWAVKGIGGNTGRKGLGKGRLGAEYPRWPVRKDNKPKSW